MKSRGVTLQNRKTVLLCKTLQEWFPCGSPLVQAGKVLILGVFYGAGVLPQQRGINHPCRKERPFLLSATMRKEAMNG